eukprot:gene5050-biopygen12584
MPVTCGRYAYRGDEAGVAVLRPSFFGWGLLMGGDGLRHPDHRGLLSGGDGLRHPDHRITCGSRRTDGGAASEAATCPNPRRRRALHRRRLPSILLLVVGDRALVFGRGCRPCEAPCCAAQLRPAAAAAAPAALLAPRQRWPRGGGDGRGRPGRQRLAIPNSF